MNRTIKFLGKVYGSTPATVSATIDGASVFSGSLATSGIAVFDEAPFTAVDLFSTEIPVEFLGTKSVSITVESGDVVFSSVVGNYFLEPNPAFTPTQFATLTNLGTSTAARTAIFTAVASPALSAGDITTLETAAQSSAEFFAVAKAHNITLFKPTAADDFRLVGPSDPRTNVLVDGVAPTGGAGVTSYEVTAGSTITFDLQVGFPETTNVTADRSAGHGADDYTA